MDGMRPKMRPKGLKAKKKMGGAPMNSPRPRMRPRGMDATPEEIAALERGNRMQMMEGRENEEIRKGEAAMKKASPMGMKSGGALKMVEKNGEKVPFYAADGKGAMKKGGKVKKMKSGGKIRGYGMARGGKVCKMR